MSIDIRGHRRYLRLDLYGRIHRGHIRKSVGAGHLHYHHELPYAAQQLHVQRAIDAANPMKIIQMLRDSRGASAVEFALTAPVFFLLLFAMIEGGLLVWTQIGLQHGAEAAARCASINSTLCGTTATTQNYAAQNAFGLSIAPSVFSVTSPACGSQVSATYTYGFLSTTFGVSSLTLNAQSCFPK